MCNARSERREAGILFINVDGIEIAAYAGEQVHVGLSNGLREGGTVPYLDVIKSLAPFVHDPSMPAAGKGCQSDMELTKRTLLRHLLVAGLLAGMLPIALGSQGVPLEAVMAWARLHYLFHLSVLGVSAVVGLVAEHLVRRHLVRLFFVGLLASSRPRAAFRDFRRDRGSRTLRLLLLWGGCSRCVAYWTGGAGAALISALYWENRMPAVVYFGLLGAALSAATATGAHLRHRLRAAGPEE